MIGSSRFQGSLVCVLELREEVGLAMHTTSITLLPLIAGKYRGGCTR
jgi:hypothetical protein